MKTGQLITYNLSSLASVALPAVMMWVTSVNVEQCFTKTGPILSIKRHIFCDKNCIHVERAALYFDSDILGTWWNKCHCGVFQSKSTKVGCLYTRTWMCVIYKQTQCVYWAGKFLATSLVFPSDTNFPDGIMMTCLKATPMTSAVSSATACCLKTCQS